MAHFDLHCTGCESSYEADMATLRCRDCDSPLEVWYDDAEGPGPQPPGWDGPALLFPVRDAASWVSLGEGNTPCIELQRVAARLGLRRVQAKLEFLNPTGSFKDRGTAVMMSVANESGVAEVVEDSSGNAGASVAAYAARAGITAHIFAPMDAPAAKMRQIKVYGSEAHLIEGPREAAASAAMEYAAERGLTYASHNLSPYFIEGTRTFAHELARQLPDGLPDHVVMPVGNGSLFIGAWKGFEELEDARVVSGLPRFHCIQARAVMPIVAAYEGKEWQRQTGAGTVAGGISVGAPPREAQILDVIRASKGTALAVDDDDILRWHKLLAEDEGIYAEPTAAAAFAGLERLARDGTVGPDDAVLVPVTGSGLKDTPPG